MREILFRGKRTDTGEWVYGDLLNVGVDYDYAIRTYGGREHGQVNAVNEKTVGEYTGLEDVNGKRIFEGDVVRKFANGKEFKGVVECKHGSFGVRFADGTGQFICFFDCGEVIGNIHDNPELLKESEDTEGEG